MYRRHQPYSRLWPALWVLGLAALVPGPRLQAQQTVVYGRVEDAQTRQPVEGVRVFSGDSTSVTYSDSTGFFAVVFKAGMPLTLHTERLGYLYQQFDLPAEASARLNVVLIEQAPIEIEGIDVVTEQKITILLKNMERHRKAYPYAMNSFDQAWLQRFAPNGTPYEVVHSRLPFLAPCDDDPFRACGPGRGVSSFNGRRSVRQYIICIDGWEMGLSDLGSIPNDHVAQLTILKGGPVLVPGMIQVYTVDYMFYMARNGRTDPAQMGAGAC
jgi:hypothetical protein